MHKCTYCDAELEYHDYYGRICSHQDGKVLGQIFKCPNHEGFETEEEARKYDDGTGEDGYVEDWQEIVCDSSIHHVSGSFYTDGREELHEGYPC